MQHNEFAIGGTFWCGGRFWRCSDIGSRVIVAIRLDRVAVAGSVSEQQRALGMDEAEAGGWFNGPPYAVAEIVFDEDDIEGCALEPDAEEGMLSDRPEPLSAV
jgi:hypothetical protein